MNVREAILKAADSIERQPGMFRFSSISTAGCGTPGCALGWISAHLGGESGQLFGLNERLFEALGFPFDRHDQFYERMADVFGSRNWWNNAGNCAKALRLYANKYHPADKPNYTGIPASVRAIFAEKVT